MGLLLLLLSPWSGCYTQPTLAESWQLDRLRILAVQAEPAEPQPGDTVTFTALYYPPVDATRTVVWFACLPTSASDYGCNLDPSVADDLSGLDPSTMTADELQALEDELVAAGLIGFEPYLSPSWTTPTDALDGLDDTAALEGVDGLVTLTATPADAKSSADVEIAYKRIPISLATTPNHNPDLTGWTVDGDDVADGGTTTVGPGGTLTLDPVLGDGSIEDYTYRNDQGVDEDRTEEPYFTFSAEDGSFDETALLYPSTEVVWTAPSTLGDVLIDVVIRDRRGGMDWLSLTVTVE